MIIVITIPKTPIIIPIHILYPPAMTEIPIRINEIIIAFAIIAPLYSI